MGKRKRSKEYDRILKKIRKLESKLREKSSSESDSNLETNTYWDEGGSDTIPEDELLNNQDDSNKVTDENTNQSNSNTQEVEPETKADDIDPEVLEILGEDPSSSNLVGDDINKHVALRWQHILLNGLPKETKTDIIKQYLIPANCNNLRAPKLNPEMKAALTEINYKKDLFNENKQNQLSSCLAALGRVLDKVLEQNLNQDIIKPLSDAGRLLCDYHYRESQSRRYTIMRTLNKETRDVVKDTKIDEYLFGSELAEQLKLAKAISKSGTEMKATVTSRPTSKNPSNATQRGSLNWRGAPRAAANGTRPSSYVAVRRQAPQPMSAPRLQREHGRQRESANSKNYRQRTQRQR